MRILSRKFQDETEGKLCNVAAAVVGGAVVGGVLSSGATKSAANSQAQSAEDANATQLQMYNQTREDNAPFRYAGLAASNKLSQLLGIDVNAAKSASQDQSNFDAKEYFAENPDVKADSVYGTNAWQHWLDYGKGEGRKFTALTPDAPQNYQSDPSYGSLLRNFDQTDLNNDVIYQNTQQYAQDQGNLGVNRLAAASGSQLSGATIKALQKSGANIANQYGNDAFNRTQAQNTNIYNRLAGVSGAGQQATNQVSSAGANTANQISNNQTSLGNARGASAIAQGNALSGALNTGINAYANQSYLNSLNSPSYGVAQQPGVTSWVSQG